MLTVGYNVMRFAKREGEWLSPIVGATNEAGSWPPLDDALHTKSFTGAVSLTAGAKAATRCASERSISPVNRFEEAHCTAHYTRLVVQKMEGRGDE